MLLLPFFYVGNLTNCLDVPTIKWQYGYYIIMISILIISSIKTYVFFSIQVYDAIMKKKRNLVILIFRETGIPADHPVTWLDWNHRDIHFDGEHVYSRPLQ